MNLKQLLPTIGENYNFHTHTQFCDGRSDIRSMASAAANIGYRYLGFSPHSPISIPSPCNMLWDDVELYLSELAKVRSAWIHKMEIFAGMEIDYLSPSEGPHISRFQGIPLDYRIGSVHFLPTQEGEFIDCDGSPEKFIIKLHKNFRSDLRYIVERYYSQVCEMIELGGFDILAHPDKIARNAAYVEPHIEEEDWYRNLVTGMLAMAKEKGLIIEINTKIFKRNGRLFPERKWWHELSDYPHLIVNSDAHEAELLTSGRQETFELLINIK